MKNYYYRYPVTIGTPVYVISNIDNGFSIRHGVVSQVLEYEPEMFRLKLPWGWEPLSSILVTEKEARLAATSLINKFENQTILFGCPKVTDDTEKVGAYIGGTNVTSNTYDASSDSLYNTCTIAEVPYTLTI
jgi:hypothetical protein